MKCERCGHELDNDDLFCSKCGKAVFEEYMDEDDIWEFYKSDEELKDIKKETAAAKESDPQEQRAENAASEPKEEKAAAEPPKPERTDHTETDGEGTVFGDTVTEELSQDTLEDTDAEAAERERETPPTFLQKEENPKDLADTDELPFEDLVKKAAKESSYKPKKEKRQGEPEKKNPVWLISGCILIVCLLVGVLWGVHAMQQMDEEKKAYYAKAEQEDKTAGAKGQDSENTQGSADKEADAKKETENGEKDNSSAEAEKEEKDKEAEKKEEKPKEEKKEEKKQEYFKLVDADSIDFSKFQKISIASTDQNSQQSSDNYDYSAASAADGDTASSWQEGEDGLGEGTGIRLDFDKAHKVRYMVLYLGNWRSEDMWKANARPASLTISVGDSQKKDVEFTNEKKAFCLSFDEPVEASYVSLYIKSGFEGDRWNDNCISEVELYE